MYYALEHYYGRGTIDSNGNTLATVHAFGTAGERDEWCAAGPDYVTEAGYREAVSSKDRDVRSALYRERTGYDPAIMHDADREALVW